MITNASLTVYHKGFDKDKRLETWTRHNYDKVWFFGGKGSSINKGYENANDVDVRIPYSDNSNLQISNFKIGDIVLKGNIKKDIKTQQELFEHEIYNITSINNNDFGHNQHIRLGGK